MKIWVVTAGNDYEGTGYISFHTTKELADKRIKELENEEHWQHIYKEEEVVEDTERKK